MVNILLFLANNGSNSSLVLGGGWDLKKLQYNKRTEETFSILESSGPMDSRLSVHFPRNPRIIFFNVKKMFHFFVENSKLAHFWPKNLHFF